MTEKRKRTIWNERSIVEHLQTKRSTIICLNANNYKNNTTKLMFRCSCEKEWSTVWNSVHQGRGCPKCANASRSKKLRKSTEAIDAQLSTRPDISCLDKDKYENVHSELRFKCTKCTNVWTTTWNSVFDSGTGCPKCARVSSSEKQRSTTSELESFLSSNRPEIKCLDWSEYKNNQTRLLFRHTICETEWRASFGSIQHGSGCPACASGKSEEMMRSILEKLSGKSFPKVRPAFLYREATKRCLELDAYCAELNLAFEYQGPQHYAYPNYFHTSHAEFCAQIDRDLETRDRSKEHGVTVVEVDFKYYGANNEGELRKFLRYELRSHGVDVVEENEDCIIL